MGGPLRILHVVVNMNRGGAETLIMNLYRNIDRSKVQFDFLTCIEGVFDSEIQALGGKVYRIPYISQVGHSQFVKELKEFFYLNNQYQIVHSHLDKMSGLVLREAKKTGIPIRISHSHNTRSEGGMVARFYKSLIGSLITPNSTHLVACSNDAAQWLFKEKYHTTTIVKNGIDIDRFKFSTEIRNHVRNELGLDHSTFVLSHVGRFNHQKNHSYLLEIFLEVTKEIPNSVLVLVGDGELRPEIENKIQILNLQDKVKLLGIRSDIPELLQAFDLFIFPSLHEGLPVSLIEAQGSGLPCVISNHISNEVDLGLNLIDYASLANINSWVKKIKLSKILQFKRDGVSEQIIKQGFDIRKTANFIEDYYYSILR
ncbi:glycosyltransferase family 1 protein [Bacillus sp. USDA818B3_A]|uniref:glycosyltransferase family 1 protein n=1 Tax=Bacillus sp. USDA818B3_A TaxID=2698834 RepID=UPI0013682CDD|nr:glycosyltransferase family 1 protein [Bacillus sp. USDA818B3_A]